MHGGKLRRIAAGTVVVAAVVLAVGCADDGSDAAARSTTSSTTRPTSTTTTSTTTSSTTVTTTAPSTTTAAPSTAAPGTAAPAAGATHVFPVRPVQGTSYARSHHDYPAADIFAPCGSDVVAATDGTVQELSRVDTWNSKVNSGDTRGGLFVSFVGTDGVRYYGSHLREVDASIAPGTTVHAGQRLGAVGETGDAKGVGCHLHFGLSAPCGPGDWQRRRGEVWPQRYLDAWRSGGAASPAGEITARRC